MSSPYTVVIPALNEEDGIAGVIDRLKALVPAPSQIIVVDDGSQDKTGSIALSHGAKLITHPASGGYGRSLKDGIAASDNDIIAITDADGTYPIERIPEMVSGIEKGFDMVVGARHGKYYRGALLKMPARIVFKFLVEFTTGRRIPDINSGLRAFRKSTVLRHSDDLCNGFSFTTTITLIYLLTGRFVSYIPVDYAARVGSSKVQIIRDSLRTLQYIIEVIATYNPLKLFMLLSGILGVLAIMFVAWFLLIDEALLLLLAGIFFVASFVLFGMGIHAHIHSVAARRGR